MDKAEFQANPQSRKMIINATHKYSLVGCFFPLLRVEQSHGHMYVGGRV